MKGTKKMKYKLLSLTLIIILLSGVVGCRSGKTMDTDGLNELLLEIRSAEKAELINIVGESAGVIDGENLTKLFSLIDKTKPGPYPEGNTGGEITGALLLHFSNRNICLALAEGYLGIAEPELKKYKPKESHLIFTDGIKSKDFDELFNTPPRPTTTRDF